jgi:hypothetical protein
MFLKRLAFDNDLLLSIGTDYHGQDISAAKYPEYASKLKREQLYFEKDGIEVCDADILEIIK